MKRIAILAAVVAMVGALNGCSTFTKLTDSVTPTFGRQTGQQFVLENAWSRSTLKYDFYGFRRLNRMSPIVLDTMIIAANSIDGILAFDRSNGRLLWRVDVENGVEGGAQVAGDKLYFGSSDGQFYCVNLINGKTAWTFPVRAETLAAPTVEGGVVYFQSGADVIFALDAASGKQLWTYNRQVTTQLSIRATTRPIVVGDTLYAGFSDGYFVSIKRKDGTLNWERKIGKGARFHDVDATPVVDGDSIYVASFDGSLVSLKAASGDVTWTIEQGAYVPVTLGTGRLNDRLYYSTANGEILAVDKRSGKVLKTFKVEHGIATQVSLYRGFMLYGESEGALIAADAETGETVAHYESGHGVLASPTVVESANEAYVTSVGANLYAFRLGFRKKSDLLPWQTK